MQGNRVSVKIYGQEYVISGEKTREHIIKVADYVDTKMHEIAQAVRGANSVTVAVLTSVNIADDYFELQNELEDQRQLTAQMEKDAKHYVELWDEAKKSFMHYKEEASELSRQKDEMLRSLNEKELELQSVKNEAREASEKASSNYEMEIGELSAKCKELENNFFDLQMENIKLKSDLEKYKRELGI